jgi:predicted RNA-binding Zn ribbon-like protein
MVSMKNDPRPFIHVGNNLAVDFINTQFECHDELVDLLSCFDDLSRWAAEMDVTLDPDDTSMNIDAIRQLRRALKTLLMTHIDKSPLPNETLALVNQYLINAPTQQKLIQVDQTIELQPLYKKLSVDQLLGKIVYEAAGLLNSPYHQQIKHCSNEKCVLIFVDTSRSKKRRWCSMERCGNRAKASNFYHSNKES